MDRRQFNMAIAAMVAIPLPMIAEGSTDRTLIASQCVDKGEGLYPYIAWHIKKPGEPARRLRVQFTMEIVNDLCSIHGLDVVSELKQIVAQEINFELKQNSEEPLNDNEMAQLHDRLNKLR
tara:strand:+ start:533 stop:895 length:363 start_codon:yes stop_codon:yes gene_type:complete